MSLRNSLLEDAFFHQEQAKQLADLKAANETKEKVQALSDASGIKDEATLTQLAELNIEPEALSALALVPLVAVAWADGSMADKERSAILEAAQKDGLLSAGSPAHELLSGWLSRKPGDELVEAWASYVLELVESLDDGAAHSIHETIMGRAHSVAEAAGGFLGLKKKSAAEDAVLDHLDNVFHGG